MNVLLLLVWWLYFGFRFIDLDVVIFVFFGIEVESIWVLVWG